MGYNKTMLTLTVENKKITCPFGTECSTLAENFSPSTSPLMAVRFNNEVLPLSWKIISNGTLEPVYLDSSDGIALYRRTLCFILAAAAHKVFPQKRLLIGHSLGSSYYYTFDDSPAEKEQIEAVRSLVDRVTGGRSSEFELRLLPERQDSLDYFEFSAENGKIGGNQRRQQEFALGFR